jgi:hypothetical protein
MIMAGFDPGNTTGIALVDGEEILEMLMLPFDDCLEWILQYDWSNVSTIVCEDFRLFRNKAQKQVGSDFQSVQIIGALKIISKKYEIPLIMQMSSILSIAERQVGLKMPTNHDQSHDVSALLHVRYYQIRQGIYKSMGQRKTDRLLKESQ